MKMFSDCSGECCLCFFGGVNSICLAGHGDDDYSPATKEQVIENLDYGCYSDYKKMMVEHLLTAYGYEYDLSRYGTKKLEKSNISTILEKYKIVVSEDGMDIRIIECGDD